MNKEVGLAATREEIRWSTDMSAATVAAHVLCTYFDHEYGEWIIDVVFTGNIGSFPNDKWTHWKPLPLNPLEEHQAYEMASDDEEFVPAEGG